MLHLSAGSGARVLYIELRRARAVARTRVRWNEVFNYAARKFAELIRERGTDTVAYCIVTSGSDAADARRILNPESGR